MATAAAIGAALTTPDAKGYSLWLDGLDVLEQPGQSGTAYGVAIDTIEVTEAGPGGVSALRFEIDDPAKAVAPDDGAPVLYHDHTLDVPIFRGFVQEFGSIPAFGTGRRWRVECIGIEAVLDWAKLAIALDFPANSHSIQSATQRIVANAYGLGPIRAFSSGTTVFGNQAFPIEPLTLATHAAFSIDAGETVREAIRKAWSAFVSDVGFGQAACLVTVDPWYGLRLFEDDPVIFIQPDDYGTETINTATTGLELDYARAAAETKRGAIVVGAGGVAFTVPDGSGKPGDVATIDDDTVTDEAGARSVAGAYLRQFVARARGTYRRGSRPGSATVRAGCKLVLTDAPTSLGGATFRIMQIEKTYTEAGTENWTVSFGGLPPSGANLIRRLTRGARA